MLGIRPTRSERLPPPVFGQINRHGGGGRSLVHVLILSLGG